MHKPLKVVGTKRNFEHSYIRCSTNQNTPNSDCTVLTDHDDVPDNLIGVGVGNQLPDTEDNWPRDAAEADHNLQLDEHSADILVPLSTAIKYGRQTNNSNANGDGSGMTSGQEASEDCMGPTLSNEPAEKFNDLPHSGDTEVVDSSLPDPQSCLPQLQTQEIRLQR